MDLNCYIDVPSHSYLDYDVDVKNITGDMTYSNHYSSDLFSKVQTNTLSNTSSSNNRNEN